MNEIIFCRLKCIFQFGACEAISKCCLLLLMTVGWTCEYDVQNFVEIADAQIQDGMRLKISKPVETHRQKYKKNSGFASYERIRIEVKNFSNDTIYFENHFVFKDDHPFWGNFELYVSDQNGNPHPRGLVFQHYYEMLNRKAEYIMLPPDASFQDVIVVNLRDDYRLKKRETYTIFARYVNQRTQTTNFFPVQFPPGKQLWTGVLKSNTYKFRF